MSLNHHTLHDFFRNKEMNAMYLSYGLLNMAQGLISIFVPIYLFRLGYSIPWILFFFFLVSLAFVLLSFFGVRVVAHFGVKHTMAMAIPVMIFYYLGLRVLPDSRWLFFLLPILRALEMMLYNYSFHLNFIEHSSRSRYGKDASLLYAAALLGSSCAPLLGGIVITLLGYQALFITGCLFLFGALIPLYIGSETLEPMTFNKRNLYRSIFRRRNIPSFASFSGYAIESWIGMVLWPLFLFILISDVKSIGLITSFSVILSLIIFSVVGKATDSRKKKKLLKMGAIFHSLTWVGRAFPTGIISAAIADAVRNLTYHIVQVPWSAYSYQAAKRQNYFRFIVQREVVFNASRMLVIPVLIAIFLISDHPFGISFSLAAVASLFYAQIAKG